MMNVYFITLYLYSKQNDTLNGMGRDGMGWMMAKLGIVVCGQSNEVESK